MGRPTRKGLDYFSVDCIQNDSLNFVEAKHGIVGYGVLIKLWRKIYMVDGYYSDWSEKNLFIFSKDIGVDVEVVKNIVETCLSEGIFDREMYVSRGVLTSEGVQKRWLRIVTDANRKDRKIDEKYLVLSIHTEEKAFPPPETPKSTEESAQSKVKESIVNKTTEGRVSVYPTPAPRKNFIEPSVDEVRVYFSSTIGNPKRTGCWPDDKCRSEADKFFNHFTSRGWKSGGVKLVDWKAAARNWIQKEKEWMSERQPGYLPKKASPSPETSTKQTFSIPEKMAKDIGFLYQRFLEDQCTIISIETQYYNFLKGLKMLEFDDFTVAEIREKAASLLEQNKVEKSEHNMTIYMKKLGVLECFRRLKKTGKPAIFEHELSKAS